MNTTQNALAVLAQQKLGALPSVFKDRVGQGRLNEDMAGGITSGFAIVSFRGKVWRVKFRGEEKVLINDDGTPRYNIDVVVLRTSPHISKVWYEAGYVEGSTAAPDCWSVDGKKPDPGSPKRQSETCAGCKWNVWGSSRSTAGSGKGKDCADSKRLAIVPLMDIDNEVHGGPMMLRVPPASLGDLLAYATSLEQIGFPYYAVGSKISFDVNEPYPRLKFAPVRALNDDEAAKVDKLRESPLVERIISAAVEEVHTDGVDTTHVQVLPDTVAPAVTVAPAPNTTVAPATTTVAPPPNTTVAPATLGPVKVETATATPTPTPKGNADMRANLRAAGLTEEQIVAALGPEPEPEPAPDPRVAQLKAMGFDDAKIVAILGAASVHGVTSPPPAEPAKAPEPEAPKQRRGRKPKEEPAAPAPTANGHQEPVQAASANGAAPAPSPEPEPAGDLPAGFDEMLEGIIAASKQ